MKRIKLLIIALVSISVVGCTITRNQNKGEVFPVGFYHKAKFTTVKTVMILPFEIDGVSRNFIFDTGADYSLVQRDSAIGKTATVGGASKRKVKLGSERVASMKIGDVDFRNTVALNGDMQGLKEQISNFGGLIGQPIIRKANWLIDYPNKSLQISNKNLVDSTFIPLNIKREGGAPYTYISIDGESHKVIIDFGSSSAFNLPKDSKLAKQLFEKYGFDDRERDRYTLGGLQKIKEKVGILPTIKLGTMEFKDIPTTINISSQPRIGISFFKDCIIYIDNIENDYKIKQ